MWKQGYSSQKMRLDLRGFVFFKYEVLKCENIVREGEMKGVGEGKGNL